MKTQLSTAQQEELLSTLKNRFEKNKKRHPTIAWPDVEAKLKKHPEKLSILNQMEMTGGEPDVVGAGAVAGSYIFFDCSPESPGGRRSLCYDREALESRKEHRPANSAIDLANELGIKILDETQYRKLQELGKFDAKTSSWIETPEPIRSLGGAIFADFRYETVFVYHNGASSYYAARGFRGSVEI